MSVAWLPAGWDRVWGRGPWRWPERPRRCPVGAARPTATLAHPKAQGHPCRGARGAHLAGALLALGRSGVLSAASASTALEQVGLTLSEASRAGNGLCWMAKRLLKPE